MKICQMQVDIPECLKITTVFFYNNCRLSSDMVYFLVIADKPQQHFTAAESYVVTWWPGDNSDQNVQSQETTGE